MKRSSSKNIGRMQISDGRRMFTGAGADRMSMSWDATGWTIDQIIYNQLETLRGRAREQGRNNDYVKRFRQVLRSNILGHAGFVLRSLIIDPKGTPDRLARLAIEQGWKAFCKREKLNKKLRTLVNSMPTTGEALVFTELTKQGLKVKLLDPALLDVAYNDSESGKNLIRFGIEYDAADNPVAYHFNDDYSQHHPGVGVAGSATLKRTRIPAEQVHHIFIEEWEGQRRGLPWIASSMGTLFQANELRTSAVTAHRIGAAKMGFFSHKGGDEYTGDNDDDSPEMSIRAEAGTIENIGDFDFTPFDPSYPAGEFVGVHDQHMRGASAAWGIDFHTIANKLSDVNYSSARIGALETREFYKELQAWLIEDFLEPLFAKWLETELLRGTLKVASKQGKQLPLSRGLAYYLPADFVGRRWDWVDPQKEAAGHRAMYDMRATSLSKIIRERGDDPEDVFQEIAAENARMEELGITPAQVLKTLEAPNNAKEDS